MLTRECILLPTQYVCPYKNISGLTCFKCKIPDDIRERNLHIKKNSKKQFVPKSLVSKR